MTHCKACLGRAHDEDVIAYVEGLSHVRPEIDDWALERATQLRRAHHFKEHMAEQDSDVLHWPEFQKLKARMVDQLAADLARKYEKVLSELPQLATVVRSLPPHRLTQSTSRSRRRALWQQWKKAGICSFLNAHDDNLRRALALQNKPAPWWLKVQTDNIFALAAE